MNPLMRPWRQLFNFRGRATRTEYLLFHVSFVAVIIISEIALVAMIGAVTGFEPKVELGAGMTVAAAILGLFWMIFFVLFLIGHFSVAIRRLHDHGEPGLKYLLTFIPLIGIVFWFMMVFARGDDFENDYGPDPRQGERATPDELGGVFS